VRTLHMHVNKSRGKPVELERPEAATASDSPTEWPEIEGISTSVATKLLQGDAALFADLLRRFVKDYGSADFVLRPDHTTDQRRELVARVHKLRGSAGMLGANTLHAIAGSLETALRRLDSQPQESGELIHSVETQVASLNDALRQLVLASSVVTNTPANAHQSPPAGNVGPVHSAQHEGLDEAQTQKLLTFLQLLNKQDLAAMAQVDTLAAELTALMGAQNHGLMRESIYALDFARATQMLATILPKNE
jgi:HPt (histidine-containing phosphotransfer) domain-containing protein